MSSYLCWSPDNGTDFADAKMYAESWLDADDASMKYAEEKFYDWEQPEEFDVFVVECNLQRQICGKIKKFTFDVEYEPTFYSDEVDPTERELASFKT